MTRTLLPSLLDFHSRFIIIIIIMMDIHHPSIIHPSIKEVKI